MRQRWQRANAIKIVVSQGDTTLFEEEDDKNSAKRHIMRDWGRQMSKEGHGGGHDAARSEMRAGADHPIPNAHF